MIPKIVEILTEPFLKPGVLRPVPVRLGKVLGVAQTAVGSTLQKDQLPVAHFVFMNFHCCADLLQELVHEKAKKL